MKFPLICPVCGDAMTQEPSRAVCERGHSFDRARQGYFHLLPQKGAGGHGDDAEMLLCRRRFLDAGHYAFFADAVADCVARLTPVGGLVLDAGCGEGYYTRKMRDALEKEGRGARICAFDIARDAVRLTASRMEKRGLFFVASTFHVPLESGCVDVITSLFSPYAEEEFLRLLRPGGILIRAVPLEEHLFELKQAVYEHPTRNEKKAEIGAGFTLLAETSHRALLRLSGREQIEALFGMTPYAHKTSPQDRQKLSALESLEARAEFGLICYQKKK
ncbi:MAG: methyltransferase domain-containing protein [Clostridia bacterium]|nr:methyltransferase domain-containing protein [Clostridia bacterium]